MKALNAIGPDDIKRLDSKQLVGLLRILLYSEARTRVIAKHGIHVPLQITISDGGKDATWDADIEPTTYIPNKYTVYQCKAEEMGPAKCQEELLQEGTTNLKPKVAQTLDRGGAYVFFCHHGYADSDERLKKAREALRESGRPSWETDQLEFLDANKIAQWANQHTSAFAYVCECAKISQSVMLKSLGEWGKEEMFTFEFQPNEYLEKLIHEFRSYLLEPQKVARITGPSGLGKTRLAYEIFACKGLDDETLRDVLSESVVYVDCEAYKDDVIGWVDQLTSHGYSGIVVVDNCPHKDHLQLAKQIRRRDSQLSLLSLDFIPEDAPSDFLRVTLDPAQLRDIVPKIIKSIPWLKHLDDATVEHISSFAQGFPLIAILTARIGHALDLENLNLQGSIANRLLWGRDEEDPDAGHIIRCLSLFEFVGVDGARAGQLAFLRTELCNRVSEFDFNRLTKRFFRSGILQTVGGFVMVTPPPLAVALANDWFENVPDGELPALLTRFEGIGLLGPFCSRLRMLDFSDRAIKLSEKLMGEGGPLSSAEVLSSLAGSRVLRALSEVNPRAAAECVYRNFKDWSPNQYRTVTKSRRNLIWALEKLCWVPECFTQASSILMGLASGETENYANNATGQFKQLFHVILPGTRLPLIERLQLVEHGLQSPHLEMRRVCLEALGAGLQHHHFSRSSGPERRGTRPPEKDWQPKYSEIWEYWKRIFLTLKAEIARNDELSALALKTLGEGLGAILTSPLVDSLETEFREIANAQTKLWPSARESIKRALEFPENISQDLRTKLERWLTYVEPEGIEHRLVDTVCIPGWHHEKQPDGDFKDISAEKAIALAEEVHRDNTNWLAFLPILLQGEQQQAWTFGVRTQQLASQPEALIRHCLDVMRTIPRERRNPQLIRGMMHAVQDDVIVNRILDSVAADPQLCDLLVAMSTAASKSVVEFSRVAAAIESGIIPPQSVIHFALASVTRNFDDTQFYDRLKTFSARVPAATSYLLEVVYMHCLNKPEKLLFFKPLLEEWVVNDDVLKALGGAHFRYEWNELVEKFLQESPAPSWVAQLAAGLIKTQIAGDSRIYSPDELPKLLETLLSQYFTIAWPVFAKALRETDDYGRDLLCDLLAKEGTSFDEKGSPLWQIPSEEFRRWAEANKDIVPVLLGRIALYTLEPDREGKERARWHPYTLILLELGDEAEVQSSLSSNLYTFGSVGSRVQYLEKRLKLLKDLAQADNPKLRRIAEAILPAFEQMKRAEAARDEERSAGIY